jgi:hypothetical protein
MAHSATLEETFEQWPRNNAREFPVTLDIPVAFFEGITNIVTHWAVAEWIQLGTLARLLGIERSEARVMFGARIGNSAGKIKQLLDMKGITARSVDFTELGKALGENEANRNLVAHGVWMVDPLNGEYCIENPSQQWTAPKEQSVIRRRYPQAFYPTSAWFVTILADIKSVIRQLQSLDQEIDRALAPSPQES